MPELQTRLPNQYDCQGSPVPRPEEAHELEAGWGPGELARQKKVARTPGHLQKLSELPPASTCQPR